MLLQLISCQPVQIFRHSHLRQFLSLAYKYSSVQHAIQNKVLVSSSTNIFENLALEDWLYDNTNLEYESILLLWRNNPAIVIGRHQNPWLECNIPECQKQKVAIVRRKSGGGTVYHDSGNLNCSFIKRRELYNRKQNLEFVISALKTRWNVDLSLNKREDIVLDGKYKISGTASKLGGKRTYHHFTLLYSVDKETLNKLLHSKMDGVTSNATKSTRMEVGNLGDMAPDMNFHSLVDVISSQFVNCSQKPSVETVNPADDTRYPGIQKHLNDLKSWDWIYGKTPPFTIERNFVNKFSNENNTTADLKVRIEKGHVTNLHMNLLPEESVNFDCIQSLESSLEGCRLCREDVTSQLSQIKIDWISRNCYSIQTQKVLDWCLQ